MSIFDLWCASVIILIGVDIAMTTVALYTVYTIKTYDDKEAEKKAEMKTE